MSVLNIKSSSSNYDIIIEDNALARLRDYVNGKCVVVIDSKVYSIWSDYIDSTLLRMNIDYHIVTVEGGEINKNINNVLYMYGEFNKYGITKSDKIVCIGGGVLGDMTAFAGATYLRGIDVIQVPTTLLSMVDSSIGGKSAIDMPFGKNLVGVIKSPALVLIDKRFLSSLDRRQLSTGMAEIIKSGLIADENILVEAEKEEFDTEKLIELSLNVKGGVVMRDEFETGERMILNFGHTVGHAIEALGEYIKYTHGEAIAIGMNVALKLSEEILGMDKDITLRAKALFKKFNLPYEHNYSTSELMEYMRRDKKARGDSVNFVLIEEIGNPVIKKIGFEELAKLIQSIN